MTDIMNQLTATHRELGARRILAGEGQAVVLRRRYDATVEDVWDACTNPSRLSRWFLPVSGDLRPGGTYQLEGNAGGEILRCEPPHLLKVTWIFGDNPREADVSEVEMRLSADADGGTAFELEHAAVTDPKMWAEYGPGAVGVGWDLTLLGLDLHLRGDALEDPDTWHETAEGREFIMGSSRAWGVVFETAGATADEAAATIKNTTAFYAPDASSTRDEEKPTA